MSVIPVPVAGERQSLLEFLRFHHSALLAVSHGLTDEQARSTPTVSTLCIGGLIKHVTVVAYAWTQQVVMEAEQLLDAPWSLVGMMSHREEQHEVRDDESLSELLAAFGARPPRQLACSPIPTSTRPWSCPITSGASARTRTGRRAGR
jgi:hypothetical protein